jgi:hypothetical protein
MAARPAFRPRSVNIVLSIKPLILDLKQRYGEDKKASFITA